MAIILTVNELAPSIHEGAFVAAGAVIAGDVTLAGGVSVWFGAVVRAEHAPVRVGAETNMQDGVVVHTDAGFPTEIGEGVTIGHRAVLHGCRVDDNALIGIGAIVLNGAHVGRGAVVGAGAVVPEGMHVPPGSLAVGVPARILEREAHDAPHPNVAVYVDLIGSYRDAHCSQGPSGDPDVT